MAQRACAGGQPVAVSAGELRRDRQVQLIDQIVRGECPVDRRPALHLNDAGGQLGERRAEVDRAATGAHGVGLDLRAAPFFGHLTDIVGAHLPVRVACFVYGIETNPSLRLNAELQDAFWVPLTALSEPQRHVVAPVRFGDEPFERPAIRLPVADKPVLWGITYRLVMEFLRLLDVRTTPHQLQRRS